MTSMLIIEDHASMRDALRAAFTQTGRYTVAGEASSAALAGLFCRELRPELVLMDVCTEGNLSGISAAAEIKAAHPEIRVIIMTGFEELSYVSRAREAGAEGFLYKSSPLQFFIETADRIMAGETYFPEPRVPELREGGSPLTKREMEVLRLFCQSLSNGDIAEKLCISESTVKFHKANMLEKTGCKTMMDLAFYMISKGWINPLF